MKIEQPGSQPHSSVKAGERVGPPHPGPLPKEREDGERPSQHAQALRSKPVVGRSPSPWGEGRGEGDHDLATPERSGITRREAIKWVLAASATIPLIDPRAIAAQQVAVGYGYDPKVMDSFKPGDLWPLTFTPEQRKTAAALCDLIIPADAKSPSASQLNVQDFIDEWISAPYPNQERDRVVVLEGLAWLDAESKKRCKQSFVSLTDEQKRQIADDICYEPKAAANFKKAAAFFNRFRDLTTSGFYTTPEGMKDIQYVGNIPQTSFEGPPPEVLKYLKLA